MDTQLFPGIRQYVESLQVERVQWEADRTERLQQMANYIQSRIAEAKVAELVFICTHNSRRSHFGQIWAKVLADYYGVAPVHTYSGGTEATALHPNAINALRTIGFQIETKAQTANPLYTIHYAEGGEPLTAWSKRYDDAANPQKDFCAVMTCSEADEACPIVLGATTRVGLPFEDPKQADGTPLEAAVYEERCRQIATELAFVFFSIQS